jgi:hypothetical protein
MMGDSTKTGQKRSGEKQPGKYHFNPGNMSGKRTDSGKDEPAQENNVDRSKSRSEHTKEHE